jgi:hypothetical protein
MARLRDDQRHVGWQRIAQTILILERPGAAPKSQLRFVVSLLFPVAKRS